jgi:hypothetical protein
VLFSTRKGEHSQKARDVTHQVLEVMDGVAMSEDLHKKRKAGN